MVNDFTSGEPAPETIAWVDDVFMKENPNASDYRFIHVNSNELLTDVDRIRLRRLDGDIITATRISSEVYDGSIRWRGKVEGIDNSDVQILATNNPYLKGHIVLNDQVELFGHAVPNEDSVMYRVNPPSIRKAPEADILPDADPAELDGVAWKGLVHSLAASAIRIATFNHEVWRKKMTELEEAGNTEMRFFDDTPYRVVASAGYPKIDGEELSAVSLMSYGGKLTGGVFSREPGAVRVTQIKGTDYYVVWIMHPDFSKKID